MLAFVSNPTPWSKMAKLDPPIVLAALIVAAALLRATVAGHSLLSGDEAYYWLWSRRLQLSYFDHPGMLAWWIATSTWAFGSSELAIRLPSILSAAVVSWLVFDTARLAFEDTRAGLWAAVWVNATILFGASAVTATPDAPLLLFWSTALWALIRLLRTGRPVWIYVLGAALGLGFVSKYTMVLIAPGVLAVFVLFASGRVWLRRPHFYLAIALAMACTSPVLVWNLLNDWVSFRKQLAHSFDTPVSNPLKSMTTFAATQVGVVTPLILGFCLWGMGWSLWAGWRRDRPEWFLMGACSAPVLLFFGQHSLGGLVQPHWAGPAYLGGSMAAAGGWMALEGRLSRPWLRTLFRAAPALGGGMVLAVYFHMATALLPLSARVDPLSRLGGWDVLAHAVEDEATRHPGAFVYVQKHEVSGLMTYYLRGHPKAFLAGSAGVPRIPSYDASDVAGLVGRDAIFVIRTGTYAVKDASQYFDKMTLLRGIDRSWGGRVIDRYEIWLGEAYRRGAFEDQDNLKGGGPN
ncbi:MAG: glycosyltransferase family 39 protein [Phaeospirillum sp.]|nr:glycosyltransferase family 39 protein [Phaeospirillum sp.]